MRKSILLLIVLLPFLSISQTTFYWSGNSGSSDNIDQSDNWYTSGNPSSGDNLYFDNTITRNFPYSNYGSGSYFNELISFSGAGAITFRGDASYFNKIENSNNGSLLTIECSVGGRGNTFEINPVGTGGIHLTGSTVNIDGGSGTRDLRVYGNNNLEIDGAITQSNGTGNLRIYNSATVELTGQSTYTGTTILDGGSLLLNRTGGETISSSSAVTVNSGATLEIHTDQTIANLTIASGGTLEVKSGATLTLSGSFSCAGSLDIEGKIILDGPTSFPGSSATIVEINLLEIDNSSGVTLDNSLSVDTLTLTTGSLTLGTNNITVNEVSGTFSSSRMILTNSTGEVRRNFSAAGSFTYPVGTVGEYSPILLDFTSLSGSSYAGVRVVASAHPSPSGTPVDYIERYWTLTEGGFTSFSCNIAAVYVDADVVGTYEPDITCGKYSSGSWSYGNATVASTNTITYSSATSFSDISGMNIPSLPVHLIDFSAYMQDDKPAVKWSTASEYNSSHFNVYSSSNGVDKLFVSTADGQGNSNEVTEYEMVSDFRIAGDLFFFLEQVDFDGKTEWFGPVKLTRSKEVNIQAFFKEGNQLQINTNTDIYTRARLVSLDGKEVESMKLTSDIEVFNLPSLRKGIYLLELSSTTGTEVVKLIK